jgi:serine/threonine-protein kinase RsbW
MNRLHKELRIASSLENLTQVERFVEEICDAYYITNSYFGNILLAIEEAVNNAIVHGNRLDPAKEVLITFTSQANSLCFIIADEGNGFDTNKLPDPLAADDNAIEHTGKGIFLIRSLADKMQFNLAGNQVEIVFYISSIYQETTLNRISQLNKYFQKQKTLAK